MLTLGCRVNQYETEALAEELFQLGIIREDFNEKCDIYIINTCAVTEESVRKSRQMVRRARNKNSEAFIGVMGCAAQLKSSDFTNIKGVSFVCGTRNKFEMLSAVLRYYKNKEMPQRSSLIVEPKGELKKTSAVHFERTRAYVKIQDGCNGKCTYCVIPSLRGSVVNRNENEILEEVNTVADNGFHEVVLTGIETAAYGKNLSELIKKINNINGIERIRMGSLEPSFLKKDFIDSIYEVPALAHHFHISIQNGSDRILALMKRKYNTVTALKNIDYIRQVMPDVNFSADVIVGFPTETEEDFNLTCEFVKKAGFLHLHLFAYSRRPQTEAAKMKGQIPDAVKSERLHILKSIAEAEKEKILKDIINKKSPLKVLIETEDAGFAYGHSGNFTECAVPIDSIKSCQKILKGSFVEIIPEDLRNGSIIGRPR